MTMPKFPLGRMLITRGVQSALNYGDFNLVVQLFGRHQSGHWGEVDAEDWARNDLALQDGDRLVSAYTLPNGVKLWVITEADRSATTALLPEES